MNHNQNTNPPNEYTLTHIERDLLKLKKGKVRDIFSIFQDRCTLYDIWLVNKIDPSLLELEIELTDESEDYYTCPPCITFRVTLVDHFHVDIEVVRFPENGRTFDFNFIAFK